MTIAAPQAGFVHILSVVSRSGRASAELMRVDLDETDEELSEVADRAAAVAYSRLGDADRHADLSQALYEALQTVERTPGQPARAEASLEDGRRARAERIISLQGELP